jgi:pimeloyl-ACP methyl ester carboxylesterase
MAWKRKILILLLAGSALLERPLEILAQTPARALPENAVAPGLVIVVEGIGGVDLIGASAGLAVRQAGLPHEVHHFVWTHGTGKLLRDLQDTQHVLKKAEELAAFIKDYRARFPERPIYVIGKSGGTGLVLYALQTLPANTVERVILLSPAVSPTFDLRGALRSTRREIVSFYSRNDRMVLGWGTSQFGTIDRYYGKSAGLVGFATPTPPLNNEDHQMFMRLIQVPWSTRMLRDGSIGNHTSTSMPWFLSSEVVPWLR